MNKERGLTAGGIKIIALVCMIIDHFAASIYQGLVYSKIFTSENLFSQAGLMNMLTVDINGPIYLLLRAIGRVSFPIYCFFIVEGFKYTHSKGKYLLRLFIFALISEVPFDMAIFGTFIYARYQNVYFTLAIGLAMIWMIDTLWDKELQEHFRILLAAGAALLGGFHLGVLTDKLFPSILDVMNIRFNSKTVVAGEIVTMVIVIGVVIYVLYGQKKTKVAYHLSVILCAAGAACTLAEQPFLNIQVDYGALGIVTILIMYLLRNKKIVSMAAGCGFLGFMSVSEIPCLLAVPLIALYNGKRGKYNKYIFYILYPAHLLLFGLICLFMRINPLG